jgi:hypothetical protein
VLHDGKSVAEDHGGAEGEDELGEE